MQMLHYDSQIFLYIMQHYKDAFLDVYKLISVFDVLVYRFLFFVLLEKTLWEMVQHPLKINLTTTTATTFSSCEHCWLFTVCWMCHSETSIDSNLSHRPHLQKKNNVVAPLVVWKEIPPNSAEMYVNKYKESNIK